MKLGKHNVDDMMRTMSIRQWNEWKAYMELAPFAEEREDIRVASICQILVNMNRDTKKHPDPFPLHDFVMKFGDLQEDFHKKPEVKPQTPEQIESIIRDWVTGANAIAAQRKQE